MLRRILPLLLLLVSVSASAETITGTVIRVSDGDTLVIRSGAENIKVRLYGVDAPEKKQDFGNKAKDALTSMTALQTVQAEVMDKDRYGRTVAIVTVGDAEPVNQSLLRLGLAWVYDAYCKSTICADWRKVERTAREARAGLWSDPAPTPPWEYRRRKH